MKSDFLEEGLLLAAFDLSDSTTIAPKHPYVYDANTGWINATADTANGAVIGQSYCSGYLYSANGGCIHLVRGNPSIGQKYCNSSLTE